MNDSFRCACCNTHYEISWDDNEECYYSEVEDTDNDLTDYDNDFYPEYCPFCGTHVSYDDRI